MVIIGISGKKQSGKDEVCKHILEHFPDSAVRIAFADALKLEVAIALVKPLAYIDEHKDNLRLILQGWGTDYRRKLHGEDYWVRQWLRTVKNSSHKVIVCPDVRFINEADTIKKMGGYVIRVDRKSVDTSDTHPSETALDNYTFDHIIDNNATIKRLQVNVDVALEMLGLHT